jgi:hypothetical protein
MFRHSVLFAWKPDATEEQMAAALEQIASLPDIIPTVRGFSAGADAAVNADNYDYAVIVDFDDAAGYLAYRDDPRHRDIVAKYISPITAERAAVQYEF